MTTVIRAYASLSAPPNGSKVIPTLPVAGIVARYHADAAPGANGATVAGWSDLSASGFGLTPSASPTATIDEDTTYRAVKLAGNGAFVSPVGIAMPNQFTIACRVYLTENPASVSWMAMTVDAGTSGGIAALSGGTYRAYGYAASSGATTAAHTKPGWATVVATFDAVGQTSKIALNGGAIVTAPQTWSNANPTRQVRLSGGGTTSGIKYRQVVILNHIADTTEMGQLATALAT